MALSHAADHESEVRKLFNALTEEILAEVQSLLAKIGAAPSETTADRVHALFVGFWVINLATDRRDGRARWRRTLRCSRMLAPQRPHRLRK